MQEVNELMNEMSDFDDESEETSDLIEERSFIKFIRRIIFFVVMGTISFRALCDV
jgi:hypothetical protein